MNCIHGYDVIKYLKNQGMTTMSNQKDTGEKSDESTLTSYIDHFQNAVSRLSY